ncbi:MAG: hypothetical protein KDD38_11635 [Bdellovibrionales bacterium]|nr:hypothetical protein [Bdellovibrionales bacterium]
MKKNISLLLKTAAIAGFMAGSVAQADNHTAKKDGAKKTSDTKAEKNGCGGPNGCGGANGCKGMDSDDHKDCKSDEKCDHESHEGMSEEMHKDAKGKKKNKK